MRPQFPHHFKAQRFEYACLLRERVFPQKLRLCHGRIQYTVVYLMANDLITSLLIEPA